MNPRTCWRCGKEIEPDDRYSYRTHDYHRDCALILARRDDPVMARMMERHRANRAQREAGQRRFEERKETEAAGGPTT